uniref:Serine rich endogenous peptide 3 n=1 Tax=Arabidopsis thaliana TaxID=3702 RepID=SCOP3_ARATH|nr:RecName: Full=Serine rich endogenous peptide 3; Short=AtSCOOP3; AltName: Full=Phytocytokine SCOOP3; AltName: Full=Probable precursor of serine rich endogenous peptide phytocytokine 3; Flags: Precursor [Arabidopsis thaliana]
MTKKGPLNLRLLLLLLVVLLPSCSNCALTSSQELRPSSEWRRKMITVWSKSSY